MSTAAIQLDAGGLLPSKAKVDAEATERIVARTYRHPALGSRPVIRLASDRLGPAEDLAMEFLGFEAPSISAPLAHQQRRSLGFAAWALINDPANARFALDLVKRMKAAARQARSKPGHAWDAYTEMAKDLGRSARHFLPPFWEEVGRAFKDLGNQTYAGRALTKSLEAERVHAIESDRARRRDVVLEFVLAGCLAGSALSDYGNDLQAQYEPAEAFAIFRDLCVRRTRGGMAPWAAMPKDFSKLAKAAGLTADQELEKWLEEVIDAPAMGRAPHQFWKTCSPLCKRIVERNSEFAVALLRHTRPEPRYYGESKLGPWLDLLDEWGVLDFLWDDEHRGAPPLGEPMAQWFGRIVRDDVPAPKRTLEMLEKLAPRLRRENQPLPLSEAKRYGATSIDVDVLEACLVLGIKVDDPPSEVEITFSGWLSANVDHPFRNQDLVKSPADERFAAALSLGLAEALTCRGGSEQRGYRQTALEQRAFPAAAGDRPGILAIWRQHAEQIISRLETSGLASFEAAQTRLASTFWPDTLRLFPDLAERLRQIDPTAVVQRTLQAGIFDEYGLPALESALEEHGVKIQFSNYGDSNVYLTFPNIIVTDKAHAYVVASDGTVVDRELRLPKKTQMTGVVAVGDDLAVSYRDDKYAGHFCWLSNPTQTFGGLPYYYRVSLRAVATPLPDGSIFLGDKAVRSGDKQMPQSQPYIHDGERFWRMSNDYDAVTSEHRWKIREIDPQTGKVLRDSVPPWFEETEGGEITPSACDLRLAPAGSEDSPLGTNNGLLGWKAVKRTDGTFFGEGIDGRRWDKPLHNQNGAPMTPVALLRQPGTDQFLPVASMESRDSHYWLWDPSGTTVVASLQDFESEFAYGQVTLLPLDYWHLLKVRDETTSKALRTIHRDDCATLFDAASQDRSLFEGKSRGKKDETENPLTNLLAAVKDRFPSAPERLALGLARLVERAEKGSAEFNAFRDKLSAESTGESTRSSFAENRKSDIAAGEWGLQGFYLYGDESKVSVTQHLFEAAEFLKGNSKGGNLPRTKVVWFAMLENLPLTCWKAYWRAVATRMSQKENQEAPWLEFLKLWHELGIAELPGQFDLMEGYPEGTKKKSWGGYDIEVDAGVSFTITNGEDRFILIENETYNQLPYAILRYSTAKNPAPPPGYEVKNVRKIKSTYDREEIAAFIAAAESSDQLPLPTREELNETANRLAASPAEIGLIWLGALNLDDYQSNFLPSELRQTLGWKTTEASAGRQALRNLNRSVLDRLCESIVAEGCAAPFAADRSPVLRSLEKAWTSKMPKRLKLEAALQTRLSALGKTCRWHQMDHEELLSLAANPEKHAMLQPKETVISIDNRRGYRGLRLTSKKGGKDESELGDSLRSIVQLVGLLHAESPAGHPARAAMPALIKRTTAFLNHAQTLLPLRNVHLYENGRKKPPKPSEWLNKHLGKTKANAKDGTVRFDDALLGAAAVDNEYEVFVAFRPAKLKTANDMARLLGLLGIDVSEDQSVGTGNLPTIALIKSPGFQKLQKSILAKDVPEEQWPQNPSHTAQAVVDSIRKKYKLGEDAAILYAQLLALPDPTTANICRWNGWKAAQLKKASAELIAAKLVLEASRARAGRSLFLPGEWMELKAPWLPIESWKLAHLTEVELDARDPLPAGGPMVLRPFDELFAAAWKRVQDGDVPRYQEVKRKKKSK